METTGWLKMSARVGKRADAKTVNLRLDLAGRAENRGNLGRVIPCIHGLAVKEELEKSAVFGLFLNADFPI